MKFLCGGRRDVNSVGAIVRAYYDVILGPAGEVRNGDRFRSLLLDDARFVTVRAVEDRRVPVMIAPAEFMQFNKKYLERDGYFESETSRSVDSFGGIAHVFSTHEDRHKLEELKLYSRGIHSIQLLNTGPRWWIVTVGTYAFEHTEATSARVAIAMNDTGGAR